MVKLFIGNIPPEATPGELKALFEQYGKVTECDIITNYGFVHMEEKKAADEAVANLNQYKLHDVSINVEHSRGKPKESTKLHVSGISPDCTSDELREKFEQYGAVLECDIVKDFAFVHMEKSEEALEAIRNLNHHEFKGKRMHVHLSTSRLRVTPGMGERSRCYRCGKDGHWSLVCPLEQMAQEMDLASSYGHDPFADPYVPMRNAAAAYAERMHYERERRNLVDYYHRYRIRPSSYDGYMDRRLPPIAPPSVNALSHRKRLESSPYERYLLPPPPPPIPNYYARERSPIRRPAANAADSVDDYASDRRLAPTVRNTTTTTPLYETPRYMRNTYAAAATDRTQYY